MPMKLVTVVYQMLRVMDTNVHFLLKIHFKDTMKEVELECLCFDANEIESGYEVDKNDSFVCEVTDDSVQSRLYGAPPGWSPPFAPNDWSPTVNTNKGEPLFEDVDNPGGWSSYTFRPMFKPRG